MVVNCVECYTAKLVYECILNELSGTVPSPSNDYAIYRRCDNMDDFVRHLRLVEEERGVSGDYDLHCERRVSNVNFTLLLHLGPNWISR